MLHFRGDRFAPDEQTMYRAQYQLRCVRCDAAWSKTWHREMLEVTKQLLFSGYLLAELRKILRLRDEGAAIPLLAGADRMKQTFFSNNRILLANLAKSPWTVVPLLAGRRRDL